MADLSIAPSWDRDMGKLIKPLDSTRLCSRQLEGGIVRADPPLIQARGPGSAWAFCKEPLWSVRCKGRGPQPWRRVPLTVLSAGVFLTELVGADLSSCRGQVQMARMSVELRPMSSVRRACDV